LKLASRCRREIEPSLKKAYRESGGQVPYPGRKGRVPQAVIDQRVGRRRLLNEAVQGGLPERSWRRCASTRYAAWPARGRSTEFADGEAAALTAEMTYPEINLPDWTRIRTRRTRSSLTDDEDRRAGTRLREPLATSKTVARGQVGDSVQIDLKADR